MNVFACGLPLPPSANGLFATDFKTKRRFISKEYASWKKEAARVLIDAWERQGSPKFDRHLQAIIYVGLNYRSDISGRIKAIEDALVQNIPGFPDDRYIDRIEVERVAGLEGARIIITQLAPPEARSIGEIIDPIMADIMKRVERAA